MNQNISEQLGLDQATQAVHQIWYAYAEGYLPALTGTQADEQILPKVNELLPEGWTGMIRSDGAVAASRPVMMDGQPMALVVEKNRNGKQRLFKAPLQ